MIITRYDENVDIPSFMPTFVVDLVWINTTTRHIVELKSTYKRSTNE